MFSSRMRACHGGLTSIYRFKNVSKRSSSFLTYLQTNREATRKKPGLFGLQGLHQPEDWPRIADQCVADCLHFADEIRAPRRYLNVRVLQTFDTLSDRLCSVLDVAELCRNVHPNSEFVEAANEAFLEVSNVTKELNSDYALYEPLHRLLEKYEGSQARSQADSDLPPDVEDMVMVKSLTRDFERGGIHLGETEKRHLLKLQSELDSLSARFLSHSAKRNSTLQLPSHVANDIPPQIQRALRLVLGKRDYLEVPVTSSNASMLLKWVSDSRVREKVFRMIHSEGQPEKTAILDGILETRRKLANVLGEESYSHLLFQDRLASKPEEVLNFLEELSKAMRGSALKEKNALDIEKLRRESHLVRQNQVSVHGWDRSYYIGRLKARDYALSSTEVSQYFPLSACLEGIAYILKHAFALDLEKITPNDGELWHPDVEKYRLTDKDGSLLGEIFMDLYPREGKYTHAAHFSIRCGRQPSEGADYQTPVVALVCNFGRDNRRNTSLLSISEYETLFHEFGHSLHSLLSRTKYQHLSGTRVPTDFVEIPSHLFEHFAWDSRVISRISRHHKTGDPMPTRQVKALVASRSGFLATDLQSQILFSAMDLQFHGPNPPIGSTTKAFEVLQDSLTVYPPDDNVPIPSTFHHFIGYGAGYYSYIFARIISAQLWATLFERDPFCQLGGSTLRNEILVFGGARDPSALLQSVLHGRATCTAFLRNVGINDIGSQEGLCLPLSNISMGNKLDS